MPHIQQLDPHVADLIAAGEVVERPASVVKELTENAIDASAGAVTVEIQNGGMTYIRITDNGCGIPDGEAETAFLRHATSKLRREEDLEAIGTLGFRGEALAAIAAVSRMEVLTRPAAASLGTALTLEGGAVTSHEEAGCPEGTTMIVRDLFYNTPARLKFVKKDAAEGAAVFAAVQNLALSHPEVSFKFLRDGKQELLTPGDGDRRSALHAVLGRDLALGFIPVESRGENVSVGGFISLPSCCRGNRGAQRFFVNGRCIRSRTMTAALEEAYKNQRMVGKFPGCVLYLTVRLGAVDVNVHPTKQEVKFTSEREIFDAVYYAALSALDADRTPVRGELSAPREETPRPAPAPSGGFFTMSAGQWRQSTALGRERSARSLHDVTKPSSGRGGALPGREGPRGAQTPRGEDIPSPVLPRKAPPEAAARAAFEAPAQAPGPAPAPPGERAQAAPAAQEGRDSLLLPETEPWRVAGEVLNTYIIVEQGDRVFFIDKHAAHERMNFDALKARSGRAMVQELLTPLVLEPGVEEAQALLAHRVLLEEFGFTVEDFGRGAVVVRTVPGDLDGEAGSVLTELAEKLLTTGRADPDAARDGLMHTMACKAAIKGGQKNDPQELERVAAAVMSGAVKYCPHGRPVAIELTRGQLEKQFRRT